MRESNAVPAIAREYNDDDHAATVLSTPYDSVSFTRGFGDSGSRVEMVEKDCPNQQCRHDRMIRYHDVSPEIPDTVEYYCLNPNCGHFIKDELSYAFSGQNMKKEPTVTE